MSYQQAAKLGLADNWLRITCPVHLKEQGVRTEKERVWKAADQRLAQLTEQWVLKLI